MRKGFTLIELLAVIVILAIIALIAFPIVIGIINSAREQANKRSIDLYASAVKNAIAVYELNYLKSPYEFGQLEIEYTSDVECLTQEIYEDKSIYLANCKVNGDEVDYTYGEEKVETSPTVELCSFANEGIEGKVGAKYTCSLGLGANDLVFYVLEEATPTKSTTLIYEKNYDDTTQSWCQSGTDNTCNADGLNGKLNEIRTAWSELGEEQIGLPTYAQINNTVLNSAMPSWVYDNLDSNNYGYWTSTKNDTTKAYIINYNAIIESYDVSVSDKVGVRPVITLDI